MSNQHDGNVLNSILLEEHDGDLNAKRSSLVSAPTIYVIYTPTAPITVMQGTIPWQSLVSLSPSASWIGLVSIAGVVSFSGNATLNPSPNYIGLATITEDGYSFYNYISASTVLVKSGAGKLHTLTINTRSTGGQVKVYDSLLPGTGPIAKIDTTLSTTAFLYDVNFTNGLTLDTSSMQVAADLTISYR